MSTITYRPALRLAHLLIHKDKSSKLVLLSGPSGWGKSILCQQIADRALSSDLVTGGLIFLSVIANGRKTSIAPDDPLTGGHQHLAIRRGQGTPYLQTKGWLFDTQVLVGGNQQLLELSPCHVVIVDELDPLGSAREIHGRPY